MLNEEKRYRIWVADCTKDYEYDLYGLDDGTLKKVSLHLESPHFYDVTESELSLIKEFCDSSYAKFQSKIVLYVDLFGENEAEEILKSAIQFSQKQREEAELKERKALEKKMRDEKRRAEKQKEKESEEIEQLKKLKKKYEKPAG